MQQPYPDQASGPGQFPGRSSMEPLPSWAYGMSGGPLDGPPARSPDGSLDQPRPPRRDNPSLIVIAWIVIVLGVASWIILPRIGGEAEAASEEAEIVMLQLQTKMLLGMHEIFGGAAKIAEQAEVLNEGSVQQRLAAITFVTEIKGPAAGADLLAELTDLIEEVEAARDEHAEPVLSEGHRAVLVILDHLYEPPAGKEHFSRSLLAERVGQLDRDERDVLRDQLDWFANLVLLPAGSDDPVVKTGREAMLDRARVAAIVLLGALTGAGVVGFLGYIGIILLIIFAYMGEVQPAFGAARASGGLYVETFAIWMFVFLLLQIAAVVVVVALKVPNAAMVFTAAGFFASLAVLLWPLLRGASWSALLHDIGWTRGRGVLIELAAGAAGYAMALPILAIGVVITLFMIAIMGGLGSMAGTEGDPFSPLGGSPHPIIIDVAHGNRFAQFQLLLVAAVAAPIVEETMFRGVLYRHLRELSRPLRLALSVLLATVTSAFIFAAIHPQGVLGIPVLMALAIAFSLVREWRGSIIPCIVMHAINNGVVITVMIIVLSN